MDKIEVLKHPFSKKGSSFLKGEILFELTMMALGKKTNNLLGDLLQTIQNNNLVCCQ